MAYTRVDVLAAALLLSLIPGFEGRYLVAAAPLLGLSSQTAYILASLSSLILALLVPLAADVVEAIVARLPVVSRLYARYVENARRRVSRLVEKWGFIGLVVFVATPLPATGQWTGGIAARLLGMPRLRTTIALALGGIASNTIVLLLAMLGGGA